MSSIAVSGIAFVCVFGGALLGTLFRSALPEHHLSADSKDIVKLGMGLVGTMAALVLALLIASAKSSYDTQISDITQVSANIIFLDRVLAHYGPETKEARILLRRAVAHTLIQIWPEDSSQPAQLEPTVQGLGGLISAREGGLYDKIQELSPKNETQRSLRTEALSLTLNLGQTRWLMYEQEGQSISMPFLVVLIFWITIIFISFRLFAPPNATVIVTLFVCALSVSGAILLILELNQGLEGLIQIPNAPLRKALAYLGQ
jgi:hypothetical protein